VTGMEGLRDVGRGELDDDPLLPLGGVGGVAQALVAIRAVGRLVLEDARDDRLGQRLLLEEELQMRADDVWTVDKV